MEEEFYSIINKDNDVIILANLFHNFCKDNNKVKAFELIKSGLLDLGFIYHDTHRTLLTVACIYNMEEVAIELLKTKKISIKSKDIFGKTAIEYARENKMHFAVEMMIEMII